MRTTVTLPELGESVTEGTITRWLKAVGDDVALDEPLVEVSTDKVDTEIPSPTAGTLLEIKVPEDETVPIGTELATLGTSTNDGPGSPVAPPEGPAAQPGSRALITPALLEAERSSESDDSASELKKTSVRLPELGESVTEGTVTRWLKAVGDQVTVDEPLLEVSTDKVDTEVPAPTSGTLLEIMVGEDETVEIGAEIAAIGSRPTPPATIPEKPTEDQALAVPSSPAPSSPASVMAMPTRAEPRHPATSPPETPGLSNTAASPTEGDGHVSRSSEAQKPVAQKVGTLTLERASGAGARLPQQDVLGATTASPAKEPLASTPSKPPPAPTSRAPRGTTRPMTRLRKVIAERMVTSLATSAQLTTVLEVDVTAVGRLREQEKTDFHAREGVKLSYFPFFAKAAIDVLKDHPHINARIDDDSLEVTHFDYEHLAIAVDTSRGLLTPVIKNAGELSVGGLARKIADVADRTRNNKIGPDELTGGTFTITNTGSVGALFDTPILNKPQVAILGTGAVVKRPVVMETTNLGETIAIRQMVYLALTYDHRHVDGADAARFLADIKNRLEAGQFDI